MVKNKLILKKNKGFYTIEAIIAIIVFLVGVLGVVQIQTNTIQAVSDAQYRINASYLADSLIGQMWVDKPNMTTYAPGNPDYDQWLAEVTASMPGVAANPPEIIFTNTPSGTRVNLTISWADPSTGNVSRHISESLIY